MVCLRMCFANWALPGLHGIARSSDGPPLRAGKTCIGQWADHGIMASVRLFDELEPQVAKGGHTCTNSILRATAPFALLVASSKAKQRRARGRVSSWRLLHISFLGSRLYSLIRTEVITKQELHILYYMLYHTILYHMILYHTIPYHTIPYHSMKTWSLQVAAGVWGPRPCPVPFGRLLDPSVWQEASA